MDVYERKDMWENFLKKLNSVEDEMMTYINYRLEENDPALQDMEYTREKLGDVRETVSIFYLSASNAVRKYEEDSKRADLAFEAWSNGLCPSEVQPWMRRKLDKVAEYKCDTGNLRKDTQDAIFYWEEDNHIFDDNYQREGYPDDEPFRAWKVV